MAGSSVVAVAPAVPRRSWRSFSLRTLLVLVLLASLPMAWVARRMRYVRLQRAAVEEIQRLEGSAMQCHLIDPYDRSEQYCPDWLRDALDEDFFTDINHVYLQGPEITDRKLELLEALPETRSLKIDRGAITDDGLFRLRKLKWLQSLSLESVEITDAGLLHLVGLRDLSYLDLTDTPITDQGLASLRGLAGIESLRLEKTRITDDGLVHLKAFSRLESLWLEETQVTDAGLPHLREMTNLRQLWLSGSQVTDAGVAELQQALPELEIRR